MVTDAGAVAAFGGSTYSGSLDMELTRPVVAVAEAGGGSYWLADAAGSVFDIGRAPRYGSVPAGAIRSNQRGIVGMVATPGYGGYWLVAAGGGVYTFGDAGYYGSMGGSALGSPVVGMASTPDGAGYWLATASGRVYAYGDARQLGSVRGVPPGPVVAITSQPSGQGYRLVTSRGAVYDFGDARYRGSAQGAKLSAPIVGMASAPTGQGYWLLGRDGGILSFGTATYRGSGHGTLPYGQEVVSMAVAQGKGTGVQSAGAFGTTSPSKLRGQGGAPQVPTLFGPKTYPAGARGYDISWPQCGAALPPHAQVAVVGVNGGWAFTGNPCFDSEARWAGNNLTTYINLNSPRGPAGDWARGPAGRCAPGALACESYNYGYNTAEFSVRSAARLRAHSSTWWLDVETASYWSSDQAANARVVAGAVAALRANRLKPAVYSTGYQWDIITGGYRPGTTAWYPTGIFTHSPSRWCKPTSFAGGPVSLVQSMNGRFDGDYSC